MNDNHLDLTPDQAHVPDPHNEDIIYGARPVSRKDFENAMAATKLCIDECHAELAKIKRALPHINFDNL